MAKTTTATSTKTATKRANAKTSKQDKEGKPKRAPSAYNLFVQAKMKDWKENNPGVPIKDAMAEIGALWRDAPENPNRGKEPKSRKPKANANKPVKAAKEPPPKSSDAEASAEESDWCGRPFLVVATD
ncbi:hypothetical protein JVT61DRAFT_10953 [Boletus reticuloceps]|uniref:HMG box domain-containing protein n=1 Tax=Boletus reticuloceps TaxID=495285 RepID=A0A8I2YFB4_9AGAM|nr:hypothetical protein JVT61DRAFT_10953 [Boletus reticuloceps]